MAQYRFVPPIVYNVTPLGNGPADALYKFYKPRARGVAVFQLEDGTFVQDTPTAENSNANVPYPLWSPGNIINQQWNPFTLTTETVVVQNPAIQVWYGGHEYVVDQAMADQLTSAGYADCLTELV